MGVECPRCGNPLEGHILRIGKGKGAKWLCPTPFGGFIEYLGNMRDGFYPTVERP